MLYIILHTVSSNFFRALYRLIQSKKSCGKITDEYDFPHFFFGFLPTKIIL